MAKNRFVIILMVGLLLLSSISVVNTSQIKSKVLQAQKGDTAHITGTFVIDQNTTDPITGEKGKYGFDSDVVVEKTGTLIVKNATIYFLSDISHIYHLIVYGNLTLYNATLTVSGDVIDPAYTIHVIINGAQYQNSIVDIEKSRILYNGWFNVTNKVKNVWINNTVFDKIPNAPSEYAYGPTPNFYDSTVKMVGVSFNNLFEHDSSGNGYIGNMTDSHTYTSPGKTYIHNFTEEVPSGYWPFWYLPIVKVLQLNITYTNSSGYDGSSYVQVLYRNSMVLNTSLLPPTNNQNTVSVENTSFASLGLTADEIWMANKSGDLKVKITAPKAGTVTISKTVLGFYIEKNFITYGLHRFDFTLNHTVIYAKDIHVDTDYEQADNWGTTHNRIALFGGSRFYALNLTVKNEPTTKADSTVWINDTNSMTYIFRYGKINVTYNGHPVEDDVNVTARPYLFNTSIEDYIMNKTKDLVGNISYGPRVDMSQGVSKAKVWEYTSKGEVYLPLLSDIVNKSSYPNSEFVGIYNVALYYNNTNVYNAQIGLDHYPNLQASNNTLVYHAPLDKYKDIDLSVKISNITPKPYIINHNLTVSMNITNSGSDGARNTTVNLYLNGNVINSTQMYVGKSTTINLNMNISSSYVATTGVYNVTVVVNQIWDRNSSNNRNTTFITVGNIYVYSWNIKKLVRFHSADIQVEVYSKYNVKTNLTLKLENSTSTMIINYTGPYNLVSGVNNIAFHWNNVSVSSGYYNLTVYANSTEIGKQSAYVYMDVDLVPTMEILSQQPYLVNNEIELRVTIHNYGSEKGENAYFVAYVNGVKVNQSNIFSINGNGVYQKYMNISSSNFVDPGKYNITVKVFNAQDYNSSNNATWKIITVGDIYVDSWSIGKLVRNHTSPITVNIYSTYAVHDTNVYLYIDGTRVKVWHELSAGTNTLTYDWFVNGTTGLKTFYVYVNSTQLDSITKTVYRDVDVAIQQIYTNPSTVYQEEISYVVVSVANLGTDPATSINIEVDIYNPLHERIYHSMTPYTGFGSENIQVQIQPQYIGYYMVNASVIGSEDWNPINNFMNLTFMVNSNPYITTLQKGTGEYENGTDIVISYEIHSAISASINATLYIKELSLKLLAVNAVNPIKVGKNGIVNVSFTLTQSQYVVLLKNATSINVHFWISIESNRTGKGNLLNYTIYTFTLKEKPDFEVVPGSFYVVEDGKEVSKAAEGVKVQLNFTVKNIGGMAANASYEILDGNNTIYQGTISSLQSYQEYNVTYNYTVKSVGMHTFKVLLNPNKNVSERSYFNDELSIDFDVIAPAIEIYYSVTSEEHDNTIYAGDHVIITVTIINKNASKSQGRNIYVSGARVTVHFGSQTKSAYTNSAGIASLTFVPGSAGNYKVSINANYHGSSEVVSPATPYTVKAKPFEIPWLWIIVAVIAGAIGGFFLYGYVSFKKEAKEYMICGNCGHLVPADAEKCPYCGAVFEKEKVKCPECGSWIDEDAKFCPVCGTVFLSPEDPEYEKDMSLKKRYEQYLSKYKEEATKYIGEEYTTEEFFNWWKTHPEYISFEDWVKRQEEEIVGETVRCPVCGALNPKGAKICRVCGSPLPTGEEEKEGEKPPKTETEEKPAEVEKKPPEEEEKKEEKKFAGKELEKITQPGVVSYEEWATEKEKKPEEAKEEKVKPVEEKKEKEGYIKCPVCGALNPPDAKVCSVCGSPLPTGEEEEKKEEKKKAPPRPVVKRKVIKKVIPVKKEEEKEG